MYNIKIYILFIMLSYIVPATSYQGLLLAHNSYDSYKFKKNILFNNKKHSYFGSRLVALPQDINIGIFTYHSLKPYHFQSNLSIIDYGQFHDSESGHTFSSKELIIENQFFTHIQKHLYSSLGIKYINSNIESYHSNAIAMDLNLYYHNNNFMLSTFIKNHGFVINHYTNYLEKLPQSYGFNLSYKPKYLNSFFYVEYQLFYSYHEINIFNELFIFDNSSISLGYTSLANNLNYGDFNYDFFTGVSIGLTTIYKTYLLNIEVKNLGAIGIINSISISKSIN